MMLRSLVYMLSVSTVAEAFSLSPNASKPYNAAPYRGVAPKEKQQNPIAVIAAAFAIASFAMVGAPQNALASSTAAQISLNSFPPNGVKVDFGDLPVVGKIISGTYSRVDGTSIESPSVGVKLPKDKLSALKAVATGGHVEVDIGGLLSTHLDIDVATDNAGVATVRIASPIIPKLPFKNIASADYVDPKSEVSDWFKLVNLGTGETAYYYNGKSEKAQFELPDKL